MTIASTTNKHLYEGDGTQTVFPYTFRIWSAEDLRVVLRDTNGGETVQDLSTDYTVSGAGSDDGGAVTMAVAPGQGERLLVKRFLKLLQEIDLVENAATPAAVMESGFDRSVAMVQQVVEGLDRSLSMPETATDEETINIADLSQAVADSEEARAAAVEARDETLAARDVAVAAAASLDLPSPSVDAAGNVLGVGADGKFALLENDGWTTLNGITVGFVSSSQFTAASTPAIDLTSKFMVGRALQVAGIGTGYVADAVYDAETGVTTVTVSGLELSAGMETVRLGQEPANAPAPEIPAGGADGDVLVKASGADRDVTFRSIHSLISPWFNEFFS